MTDDLTFTQAHRPNSFLSASALPVKLLQCASAVRSGRVHPIHLQLIPTNRCNANCPWCSCRNVERSQELGDQELWDIINSFARWGALAVTITGGGEPTLHSGLARLIANAARLGYKIGLVTNGKVFPKDVVKVGSSITWMRISSANVTAGPVADRALEAARLFPTTDLGISYTVTAFTDLEDARAAAEATRDTSNITHARYVHDLTDVKGSTPAMEILERELGDISPKLIFQHRDQWLKGRTPCLIGLLKPLVGADGYVYPCCGIQYAGIPGAQDWSLPPEARMCHWEDFDNAQPFDGARCSKCYYDGYNMLLGLMTAKVGHREFL